jgi:26S proteasome regulatory subunit N11
MKPIERILTHPASSPTFSQLRLSHFLIIRDQLRIVSIVRPLILFLHNYLILNSISFKLPTFLSPNPENFVHQFHFIFPILKFPRFPSFISSFMHHEESIFGARGSTHFDTAETIHISGMALLKMLKHGRAGIPLEVVGLLLGRFIDDYTVAVVDVFATPQTGTGTAVEAIDEAFQSTMKQLLAVTQRNEEVIGWYHSHPGFGVWLSNVDINQQMYWEKLNPRCIAIVVDPVQSVRGKVVIGAFRCIGDNPLQMQQVEEPRETTSFIGHLEKPSLKALVRGLNRLYYQMPVAYRMSQFEQDMLMSLNRPMWSTGFEISSFVKTDTENAEKVRRMAQCAENYRRGILEEETMTAKELVARHVGKIDPKAYIREKGNELSESGAIQMIRLHLDAGSF